MDIVLLVVGPLFHAFSFGQAAGLLSGHNAAPIDVFACVGALGIVIGWFAAG